MGTYDTIGGTPRHDPAADQGDDPTELEDAILGLLEKAGIATEDYDRIMEMVRAAERRARNDICIDCDGTGRYPSGQFCKSCEGTGLVGKGDGAAFPPATSP